MTICERRSGLEKFCLHTFDVVNVNVGRQVDLFVSGAQTRRQAGRERTEIDSMHGFFDLAQCQTFRKRIQPSAVWSETQTQIQDSLRREELFEQLALHSSGHTAVLHASLKLEQDLPIVSRVLASLK